MITTDQTKSRYSKQRELILQVLEKSKTHPTAEDVYNEVKKIMPKISLGTVYRNLNWLAAHRKIRIINSPDGGPSRYDARQDHHYHIRCIFCGKVEDIESSDLLEVNLDQGMKTNFEILGHTLEFTGVCPACKKVMEDRIRSGEDLRMPRNYLFLKREVGDQPVDK